MNLLQLVKNIKKDKDSVGHDEQQVSISFSHGNLNDGFQEVSVQIMRANGKPLANQGFHLGSAANLSSLLVRWQALYRSLYEALDIGGRGGIEVDRSRPTNISEVDLFELGQQIEVELNAWLQPLANELLYLLQGIQKARLVILSNDEQLRKIPWHLWKLARRCTDVDPAIGNPHYERRGTSQTPEGVVRILAVLGDASGLNLEEDVKALKSLPGCFISILKSPNRATLDRHLRDYQGWDMLFFSGHSRTENNVGVLDINPADSLTTDELRHALETATRNGTQLAFFNSCDGLGFSELERVGLSHVILMHEPIPDRIAQSFIRFWLEAFVEGATFQQATRVARERLTVLEKDYPFATWLPVICQNPTAIAPTWKELQSRGRINWRKPLTVGLLLASLVVGVRATGALRSMEFGAYDTFLGSRPAAETDSRILVVLGRDEERFSFPFCDEALAGTIAVLEQAQPRIIGLDFNRDGLWRNKGEPRCGKALANAVAALEKYRPQIIGIGSDIYQDGLRKDNGEPLFARSDRLVGACVQKEEALRKLEEEPSSQFGAGVGFADVFYDDPAETIRRISLSHRAAGNNPCKTDFHIGFWLAAQYLSSKGVLVKFGDRDDILQIADRRIPPLPAYMGAYQRKGYWGYEVLLDYRAGNKPFEVVTIADILDGRIDDRPELIRDRLVVIGMDALIGEKDNELLPGQSSKVPGVWVVAHVASQLLSIGLDGQSPIWFWSFPGECAWIGAWGIVGAWLGRKRDRRLVRAVVVCGGGIAALFGSCWLVFWLGNGWIPLIPTGIAYGASFITSRLSGNKLFTGETLLLGDCGRE